MCSKYFRFASPSHAFLNALTYHWPIKMRRSLAVSSLFSCAHLLGMAIDAAGAGVAAAAAGEAAVVLAARLLPKPGRSSASTSASTFSGSAPTTPSPCDPHQHHGLGYGERRRQLLCWTQPQRLGMASTFFMNCDIARQKCQVFSTGTALKTVYRHGAQTEFTSAYMYRQLPHPPSSIPPKRLETLQDDRDLAGWPATCKKPAPFSPKALRNYGKPKILVFLMGGKTVKLSPPRRLH